jgi:iron complex outermembrane receptor protein
MKPPLKTLIELILLMLLLIVSWTTPASADKSDTIILTAEDIRAMQALKISDVLNHVPGVKAGDSSVGIHGSYKVKVFVDGRPINDPTSSHGKVNWEMVSPEDVQRIEILRGKGGLAYGQDASGGVILITTLKAHRMSGNVKVYAGNFDTLNASAAVKNTSGKVTGGVNAGYETTEGYKTNNDKERYRAGLRLRYDLDEARHYDFSADHLRDERGLSGLPQFPTPSSRKETQNTALAFQADLNPWKSRTSYNDGYNHNTDSSRGLDKNLRVTKLEEVLSGMLQNLDHGELSFGTAIAWNHANGSSFDDQQEYAASVYAAQALSRLDDAITLTAGLRANYHSTFDHTLNPELKATYQKKRWRLTGAYSRAENIPSFYQRYNQTSSTRPNPELEMEQADNFSLSLFTNPHDKFSFSLTAFYNLLTNRITYVTGDDGVGQYQNFGEVLYSGGDAGLSWEAHSTFNIKAVYSYLDATDRETGKYLPAKARHRANLTLYWQPRQAFSLVAFIQYASEVFRDTANTKTVPEYTLVDLRSEYNFKGLTFFGEIKNMGDVTYYYADGLLAPPLTWVAGVNWRI